MGYPDRCLWINGVEHVRFDVLTLFPQIFAGYQTQSLLAKAIERGLTSIHLHDMRQWTNDPHHKIDDRPFGGGPGMILMVEPVVQCVRDVQAEAETPGRLIMLTPQGRKLDQRVIEELSREQRFLFLCGRYEGFDQRVSDILQPDEISIGDFILNGGEVASMVMIDALIRMIPGVLGDETSSIEDSFSRGNRRLEYPQYTRPREFEGHSVPEILLSGNHAAIKKWRDEQSMKRTKQRRRDLLDDDSQESV